MAKKRSLGGFEYAPFLITVVPLNKNLDYNTALNILCQCDEEAIVNKTTEGITHIRYFLYTFLAAIMLAIF